jgi:hypothetical protein
MTVQTSSFRLENLSKLDVDPGYFCKYLRDQMAIQMIENARSRYICDVGCDRAHVYSILSARNYDFAYVGIDLDTTTAQIPGDLATKCNSRLIDVPNSDATIATVHALSKSAFNANSITSNESDNTAILLLDVIEHMESYSHGLQLISAAISNLQNTRGEHLLLISTPNRQSKLSHQVNWPKYHKFEYSLNEIRQYIKQVHQIGIEDYELYGWSMSNDTYRALCASSELNNEDIPIEIARVMTALDFPEYSRDILIKLKIQGK